MFLWSYWMGKLDCHVTVNLDCVPTGSFGGETASTKLFVVFCNDVNCLLEVSTKGGQLLLDILRELELSMVVARVLANNSYRDGSFRLVLFQLSLTVNRRNN